MRAYHTYLFGDYRIAAATPGSSAFKHTFGGPPDRAGASRKECGGILIHLLHRLDLTDPAIPVAIPGVRWLPIYYCFDFRASHLGYRLLSEEALVTFFPQDEPNVSDFEDWPEDNYPMEFPQSSIQIAEYPYNPAALDDAYRWAGVFGIGKLSSRNQAAARKRASKETTDLGFPAPKTEEEFTEAFSHPFGQGRPDDACLNPKCPNRKKRGALNPIALVPAEPVPGVLTFGREGRGVQLIVQLCPQCYTIRVSNQCG